MKHDTGPGNEMHAPATRARLTAADLLDMPERDLPHELVAGELREMTPASGAHGLVIGRLFVALGQHVQAHHLGELFTEATGFHLRHDPDTVRCPDIAFVRAERLPSEGLGPGFMQLAPDLAVEVVSPDDRAAELGAKVEEYLQVGVCAVWIVDPANRTITVHEAGRDVRIVREGEPMNGGSVLPGFECRIAELVAGVRR